MCCEVLSVNYAQTPAEIWVQILAGLSLLFLSQTRISNTLTQVVFQQLRGSIHRFFASSLRQGAVGVLSALLLQTSRISTRITSELVRRRLLSLRQGSLVILGAGVGSSLKALMFAAQFEILVALLFLLGGIFCLAFPRRQIHVLSAPLIAAGCFWASLSLIWQGVSPFLSGLLSRPEVLDRVFGLGLPGQFLLVVATIVCLLFLRTGTLMIFMVLQLAWMNLVSLAAGSAIILGVNLALGLFPLENRIKHPRVGRLVWIHALNRLLCGVLILFFFPYIHRLLLIMPVGDGPVALAFRFSILHIFINFVMALSGFYGYRLFERVARWIHPDTSENNEHEAAALILSPRVRMMLQQAPHHARQEVKKQINIALEQVKRLTDANARMLSEGRVSENLLVQEQYLFETIQHSLYDLLLPIYVSQNQQKTLQEPLQNSLRVIDYSSRLYEQAYQLHKILRLGLSMYQYRLPVSTHETLAGFLNEFNELWLVTLLQREGRSAGLLENRLEALEESFFDALRPESTEEQVWAYQVLSMLRQQSAQLYQLYCAHV